MSCLAVGVAWCILKGKKRKTVPALLLELDHKYGYEALSLAWLQYTLFDSVFGDEKVMIMRMVEPKI